MKQHIGICTLDNCPFLSNSNQADLNNNGRGDACEIRREATTQNISTTNSENNINNIDNNEEYEKPISLIIAELLVQSAPLPELCEEANVLPNCGNGKIDSEETCQNCPEDVGKCSSICGDGVTDPGEDCDDGISNGEEGRCPSNCKLPFCGNGVIDPGETCLNCPKDVGQCSSICGDGVTDPGEDCDDGASNGKP